MVKKLKTALSIAGSDSSAGAGIQADLKTMAANGVYGMTVITALTAQNTQGVTGIFPVSSDFLEKQLDAVFNDIYPDAIKIGMVASKDLILSIGKKLRDYEAKNIVLDPVMVSTSGSKLFDEGAVLTLEEELFPLATLITPNIPEAEVLAKMKIDTEEDMKTAAKIIGEKFSVAVLLKGGHKVNDSNDLLYKDKNYKWFFGNKIANDNTHGTGCTLSSAIAANLAKGLNIDEAINKAKAYIEGALKADLDLGKGSGPLNHMWEFFEGEEYEKF